MLFVSNSLLIFHKIKNYSLTDKLIFQNHCKTISIVGKKNNFIANDCKNCRQVLSLQFVTQEATFY